MSEYASILIAFCICLINEANDKVTNKKLAKAVDGSVKPLK